MENIQTKQCKKCKEFINSKAKKCPKCGGKQGIPTWLIIIIVLAIIGIISTTGDQDETQSSGTTSIQKEEKIVYQKVTVDELEDELEDNAAAAKDKYNNKYLEITGLLGTIDSDLKYISLMSETDEWDLLGIHCTLKSQDQRETVKTLKKNQRITVRGKITDVGEVLGYYLNVKEIIK